MEWVSIISLLAILVVVLRMKSKPFPFVLVRRSRLKYLEQVHRTAETFINTQHANGAGMASDQDCAECYANLEGLFDNEDYVME